MNNISALKALCNAICNTFYPDQATLVIVLIGEKMSPDECAVPKDPRLLKLAIRLVQGYVESSRTEGGISTSVDRSRVDANIAMWCREYGVDADEYMAGLKVIESGTSLW